MRHNKHEQIPQQPYAKGPRTISIIEKEPAHSDGREGVPFSFSRELESKRGPVDEPLLWEGD